MSIRATLIATCCAVLAAGSPAQASPRVCGTHWVGAWAGVPSDSSMGSDISDAVAPSPDFPPGSAGDTKQPVNDASVRAIFTPSVGGTTVRVHLSNRFGAVPVTFAHTTIAKQRDGATLAAPPSAVTFGGKPSVTAAPGKDVVSDPVAFAYDAFDDLAVSTYVPDDVGKATEHYTARQYSFFTPSGAGDHAADQDGSAYSLGNTTRPFVTGLDVRVAKPFGAVVAFGDSITDGYQGQAAGIPENPEGVDANGRWPDVLAGRLRRAGLPLSVVNAAISGNRVLRDGAEGGNRDTYGPDALERLDADVLDQAGATTVIWLEGINDLGQAPNDDAAAVIAGYRKGIARMHRAGLRVLQGTLTPAGGASGGHGTAETEAKRQQINTWIRTKSPADGFVDFDAAVRDPADHSRIDPRYDGSDHLHFNLAGYRKMGEKVALSKLARPRCSRRLAVRVSRRSVRAGVRTVLRVRVRRAGKPVRGARVRLGRFKARTNRSGVARLRVRFARPGAHRLRVSAKGSPRASVTIHVRRGPAHRAARVR